VRVSAPSLTARDRDDAHFLLGLGVDLLALSFVRRAADVQELKALVAAAGQTTPVIAKIEKPEALASLEDILAVSDGIMVARGDLGVELPPEEVPLAQERLVARARAHHKPVIVATQMLESMVASPRPTRAEVSDVSHAVFSGADAVMLSAETSVGAYPVRAVAMMDRVARQTEAWQWGEGAFRTLAAPELATPPVALEVAVSRCTAQLSRDLRVRAIVVLSRSGTTAAVVAAGRPAAPVVAATTEADTCRRMNLLWGVIPRLVSEGDLEQPQAVARRLAQALGLAAPGESLLTVAGFRGTPQESLPTVTVVTV
jgi:pyruvate kinase